MYHDGSIAPFDFPGSGSATSDVLSARPSLDQSDGWPVDFSNPLFMTNPITMNHHVGSPSTLFENHNEPLRRPRKKELFADSEESMPPRSPVAGPSTRPFYLEHQPSDTYPTYGLETMTGLKRKRADSFEPIQSWLQNPNPPDMIDLVDDDSPGPSYTSSLDRKGKGKATDYKRKGKQRQEVPENPPILVSDSPVMNNVMPLATTSQVPSKPLCEPLSSYTCPICFSAPTNATLSPCGHIYCGECLFTAVKTVMLRAQQAGAPDANEARCPVCRASIPDWDGNGAGVIGLKLRAISVYR